ncbi:MAG: STAS-like domain-containing protein [Candidatus Gracilibacteria bacterium]|nr:STAS-like domain-containing protein [Candidatus Gracilibacteria bacterium]
MKKHEVKIRKYVDGVMISGRQTGNKIKNDFLKMYEMGVKIDLDFEGIENVTHSFIDELIGAFMFYESDRALEIFKFSNCNESIKEVIKFVIKDRSSNHVSR